MACAAAMLAWAASGASAAGCRELLGGAAAAAAAAIAGCAAADSLAAIAWAAAMACMCLLVRHAGRAAHLGQISSSKMYQVDAVRVVGGQAQAADRLAPVSNPFMRTRQACCPRLQHLVGGLCCGRTHSDGHRQRCCRPALCLLPGSNDGGCLTLIATCMLLVVMSLLKPEACIPTELCCWHAQPR